MLCCNSVDVTAPAAAEGIRKVPSSFAMVSDFDLAYEICFTNISSPPNNKTCSTTHHFSTKELEPLQCSHGLSRSLDISENNVCLTTHLLCPQSHNIENGTIGREEDIERDSKIGLLNLRRRKIIDVESLVWRKGGNAASLARTRSLFLWNKSVKALCAYRRNWVMR